MKILFMGTPDFSVPVLEALIEAGHQIVLCVTQPDRQKGRGKAVQYPPVKEAALRHGIPVLQPQRIREPQWEKQLQAYPADIGVVVAFGQILPKEILKLPGLGCVNVHASLLPKYRGAAPIQQAIIDGEKKTGVTIMQMDEGLDTGDMIARTEVPISPEETGGSLHDKLAAAGAELLLDVLADLENGRAVFEKQKNEDATYVGMLKKETGNIDWSRDAASIERLIRGLDPWPSAYTSLRGKTVKLWKAQVVPAAETDGSGADKENRSTQPGEILKVEKDAFLVETGNGRLWITCLQMEGKKRMDAGSFLRGYALEPGEILGGRK